jgi:predicted NBD/HSP70 family sugar kinase
VRTFNRTLVLQALYRGEGYSRADLARETSLTRVTISDLVADLIDEGLVVETGRRTDQKAGKPATLLDINRDGYVMVGLDLSDNEVFRGAVTDLDGAIVHRDELKVDGATGESAVRLVTQLLGRLLNATTVPVLGVGVGTPGLVDTRGAVLAAPNLGWSHVPLQAILARHSGLPVRVANDANAAALAERSFGGADGDFMAVRVGRGVGCGMVISGKVVNGSRFAAGELGHVVVGTDGGEPCACGNTGCLETWLAIPRLETRLANAANAVERDEHLAEAGRRLGILLSPVAAALNLSAIIVSGPPHILDGTLLEAAKQTLDSRTLDDFRSRVTVRMSTLGHDIVVLGAVVLVLDQQLGVS